ncbi:hypothetical protein SO802_015212 [Lithocarpus litseifolius]|uniref:Uncharacterized protein n=1 Tax=Lithocarpus litseifolius TaxID=425828 RepID=A0AAW2CYD2_9ROSI
MKAHYIHAGVIEEGNKKQKVDSSTPSTTPVVDLNHAAPVTKPKVDASLTRLVGPPDSGPLTILRSEGLAWERFKEAVIDKDVVIDMSVMKFERSKVHEKVQGIVDLFYIFWRFELYFVFSLSTPGLRTAGKPSSGLCLTTRRGDAAARAGPIGGPSQ